MIDEIKIGNHSNLWNEIAEKTRVNRHVVKCVVYSMLFGSNIVSVMLDHKLEIEDVVSIRMAFDNITKPHGIGQ
jgi:hypothetical protein